MSSFFKNIIVPIATGLAIAAFLLAFVFQFVKVDGTSMYPNLQNNERVLVWKLGKVREDSVIVFNAYGVDDNNPNVQKNTKYVKRVIGMPGDTIEYKNNGDLYVNGKYQPQNYISKEQRTSGTLTLLLPPAKGITLGTGKSFKVPKDSYFVLGDNRSNSNDSRYYGFVPKDKVIGVAKAPFWSKNYKLINSYEPAN
nr:signal peptidase I [Ligilactobacillus cholophilus]